MKAIRKHNSLLSQYVISALLLAFIVIVATFITYIEFINDSQELTQQANTTSELLEHISEINARRASIDKAIDTFLIEPEREDQRRIFSVNLARVKDNIAHLSEHKTIQRLNIKPVISEINQKLTKLEQVAEDLFHIRTNAQKQYPTLEISARLMLPVRNKLYTAFNTAITEIQNENNIRLTTEINNLINTQALWLKTISEYRLYLTNRFGSVNNTTMKQQETLIESYVDSLRIQTSLLVQAAENEAFGFEGSAALITLPQLINDWEIAYLAAKKINNSNKWRRDSEMMQTQLIPLENELTKLLKNIETALKNHNHRILSNLKKAASSQTYLLIGVILTFMLYIASSMFLLKTLMLKPISLIARLLKEEAHNPGSLTKLQIEKTKETEDLIDAFITMGHQVATRQKDLEQQALHDPLTSLPNRILLNQRLDYQTLIATRENTKFSLLFLDLNRFKEINDTLGHHIGDELLIQVSQRLSTVIREVDTIARLGGDEFAILLPNTERHQAVVVAIKIATSLTKEFLIKNYTLQINTSIGIAEYPGDSDNMQTLLQHADIAMYSCKKKKSVYEFYDPNEDTNSLSQLQLGNDLKQALENNKLDIYLQPKVNISTGLISGAEALLRWKHPKEDFINPEKIIELAEQIDLLDQLTYWIINQSIICCTPIETANFDLSINLSVQSLRDSNLVNETRHALTNNPHFKHRLTFEITETAMMGNPEQSINILNTLKKMGIKISIDDFGTGFSSLAYLKQLPVRQLKIDRSFVMDMCDDESDRTIVLSTINLSHSLGLDVVAEGVENIEALMLLKEMNCDNAQGYLFSKPVPAKEFIKFVNEYRPENFGF